MTDTDTTGLTIQTFLPHLNDAIGAKETEYHHSATRLRFSLYPFLQNN